MKAKAITPTTTEQRLVEHYLGQLAKLSPNARLDLIARLSQTLKADSVTTRYPATGLPDFVGAWAEDGEADKLENSIYQSRHFSAKPELEQW